jgi:hypothetical protein
MCLDEMDGCLAFENGTYGLFWELDRTLGAHGVDVIAFLRCLRGYSGYMRSSRGAWLYPIGKTWQFVILTSHTWAYFPSMAPLHENSLSWEVDVCHLLTEVWGPDIGARNLLHLCV